MKITPSAGEKFADETQKRLAQMLTDKIITEQEFNAFSERIALNIRKAENDKAFDAIPVERIRRVSRLVLVTV